MTHFSSTQRGAFSVITAVTIDRTATLRFPALRELTREEAAWLTTLLQGQNSVVARLCTDLLATEGVRFTHGGLLDPKEAARLRPADLLAPAGRVEVPAWCEQGRAQLLLALERERSPVRLSGVEAAAEAYWIFTDASLGRYVGGTRVPRLRGESLRRLLYGRRRRD